MTARPSAALLALLALPLAGCAAEPGADWLSATDALEPHGPVAGQIAGTWWLLLGLATLVFAIAIALLLIAVLRRGRHTVDDEGGVPADGAATPWLIGGTAATTAILLVVAVHTFTTMAVLAEPTEEPAYRFEIVGKRWWWEIRHDGRTIGANELHLPVGRPVELVLRSDNVIHSLWIPELAGKRDLVPGQTNTLWLQADAAGVHRGVCAEFCGVQHANMALVVVAESPERFEAWLERVRSDAAEPVGNAALTGRAVFQREGCGGCHSVRGHGAAGELGPDLTHLAGRLSIAAATLPNTRGHLGGWILDPQAIKPGSLMPAQTLPGDDVQDLLTYLEGLE